MAAATAHGSTERRIALTTALVISGTGNRQSVHPRRTGLHVSSHPRKDLMLDGCGLTDGCRTTQTDGDIGSRRCCSTLGVMAKTRRHGLGILTAVIALAAIACSSDPAVVALEGGSGEAMDEVATTTSLSPDSAFRLIGTSWWVIAIDDELVEDWRMTLSFFGADDDPQLSIEDECGQATIRIEPTSEAPVRSTTGVESLCFKVWSEIFVDGQSLTVSFSNRLELDSGGHKIVASHFESVSEVGPVPAPGETSPTLLEPSPPPPFIEEATSIPFPECATLPEVGPPSGERATRLWELTGQVDSIARDYPFSSYSRVMRQSGPRNSWGVVEVWLTHRDQSIIDRLAEVAEPDELCLQIPPVGYYSGRPDFKLWEFADPADADNPDLERFVVRINQKPCGGMQDTTRLAEPSITYLPDSIIVAIELRPRRWGSSDLLACFGPDFVEITLDEPRNGRPIVNGGIGA